MFLHYIHSSTCAALALLGGRPERVSTLTREILVLLDELSEEAERSRAVAVELADLNAMDQCVRNAAVLNT